MAYGTRRIQTRVPPPASAFFSVALVVVGGTVTTAMAAPQPAVPEPAPTIDAAAGAAIAASGSARVIVTYHHVPNQPAALAGARRVLDGGRVVARTATAADLRALKTDPQVSAVVLDHARKVEAVPPLDPGWEHLTEHLDSPAVNPPAVPVDAGAGQVVAVVDTGVLSAHHYFTNNGTTATRVLPGACFASNVSGGGDCPNGQSTQIGPGAAEPCVGADECFHGTHVAGIVAGRDDDFDPRGPASRLRGVAAAAQILPIRVFNVSAGGAEAFDSDILAGFYYVYEQRNSLPLAAVNLSVGGGNSSTTCDADPTMGLYVDVIGRLRASGIATTIAAGNDGSPDSVAFPACVSAAVTVGATTSTTVAPDIESVAPFSDRLAGVTDFVAPGDDIGSSVTDSIDSFAPVAGTSMAAPMIAGAIADIRSAKAIAHNEAGFTAIVKGLTESSDSVSDGVNLFPRPNITKAIALTQPPADTTEPTDPSPITGRFVPVTPRRLVDSRQGARQRLPAGRTGVFDFESSEVLPLGASAAALNVTVVNPSAPGFLTVFPCITGVGPLKPPDTSNVNFAEGQTVANLVVVGISADSEVCFQGNADLDVIVDLMGWYGGGGAGAFGAVTPARVLDSRGEARLAAGEVETVLLGGRFGVPPNAVAVVLNVTATDAAADGFLTVFPCAPNAPDTSNVNFVVGRAVPNQVLVGLAAGQVCIRRERADQRPHRRVGVLRGAAGGQRPIHTDRARPPDRHPGVGYEAGGGQHGDGSRTRAERRSRQRHGGGAQRDRRRRDGPRFLHGVPVCRHAA